MLVSPSFSLDQEEKETKELINQINKIEIPPVANYGFGSPRVERFNPKNQGIYLNLSAPHKNSVSIDDQLESITTHSTALLFPDKSKKRKRKK